MIFLVTYRNVFEDVKGQLYADEAHAKDVAVRPGTEPNQTALVLDTRSQASDLSLSGMVSLFNALRVDGENALVKFENRLQGRERLFARLEARFGNTPAIEAPANTEADLKADDEKPADGSEKVEGEDVAKTATVKKAKVAKAPKEKKPAKSASQPVGKVSDFNQIRANSKQATILTFAAKGGKTVEQVAAHVGEEPKYVMTALYCIHRTTAIGYSTEGGKIEITFPGSKTIADAIKPASEPKAKKKSD